MARNDHDGRSLEERLASLDAMNSEATRPSSVPPAPTPAAEPPEPPVPPSDPPAGEPPAAGAEDETITEEDGPGGPSAAGTAGAAGAPEEPQAGAPSGAEQDLPGHPGPPPVPPGPAGPGVPPVPPPLDQQPGAPAGPPPVGDEANPWLAAPPPFQGAPPQEGFAPPPPPPTPPAEGPGHGPVPPPPGFPPAYNDFNAPPPYAAPAYDGGPMPRPFDGGMLPPPYAGGFQQPDPSQGPAYQHGFNEPQPPPPPQPHQPPQPPFGEAQGPGPQTPPPTPAADLIPGMTPEEPQPPADAAPPPGNVQGAPPLEQLPPFPPEQFGRPESQPGPQFEGGDQPRPVEGSPMGMPPGGPHYAPAPNHPPPGYGPHPEGYGPPPEGYGPPTEGYGPGMPQQPPGPPGPPGAYPPHAGYAPAPPGYPQQPHQPQQPPQPQTSESLSSENLLGERRIAPSSGWRRAVYKATAGNVHPGESQSEMRRKDLVARARQPVVGGHHRVAVMSLKGGVGKTTTTTGLGSMLASLRGDRVIAVDANPDRGTLSDKVKLETAATVRDLLNNRERIHRYADVRAFTSQNGARLEVLASDRDPAVSEAFSAEDYSAVAVVLEQYYSICITDCGTGLLHSAMAGVLSLADQLVLVSSPSVDGARSASATLDWLEAHDHGHLVRNGVVVLSMVRNRTRSQVDLDKLQAHFESRCRAVVRVPYDDHLEEGAEVELEALAPATREAYLNLAAVVGDGLGLPRDQMG
ncbi:MinD/ParA family protein [Actinomadura viridis]|uniref:MinD/ParA family ATP-binding protein n=1 Tax=Actinomadura viridis TaxID=58110 RepID=UPI0036988AC4